MASTKSSAALGGAATGAATGAAVGALFGGVGAAPGALIGAGVGGILGLVVGGQIEDENEAAVAQQKQISAEEAQFQSSARAQRLSLLQTGRRFAEGPSDGQGGSALAPLAESNVQPITQSQGSSSSGTF